MQNTVVTRINKRHKCTSYEEVIIALSTASLLVHLTSLLQVNSDTSTIEVHLSGLLEIADYQFKYSTALCLIELQIRRCGLFCTHVRTV